MRAFCVALLASFVAVFAAASQEMVAKFDKDEVRIADAPCLYAAVLHHIKPDDRKTYRKASAMVGGRSYFACWRLHGEAVHVVYEDADQGLIPVQFFKEVPSV